MPERHAQAFEIETETEAIRLSQVSEQSHRATRRRAPPWS